MQRQLVIQMDQETQTRFESLMSRFNFSSRAPMLNTALSFLDWVGEQYLGRGGPEPYYVASAFNDTAAQCEFPLRLLGSRNMGTPTDKLTFDLPQEMIDRLTDLCAQFNFRDCSSLLAGALRATEWAANQIECGATIYSLSRNGEPPCKLSFSAFEKLTIQP